MAKPVGYKNHIEIFQGAHDMLVLQTLHWRLLSRAISSLMQPFESEGQA